MTVSAALPSRALERLEPQYHITPTRNWLNDPNGPIWWRGRYHLFYQANPAAPHWGPPHWAHVSSADLVHWQRHDLALSPDSGPDAQGCWSGCARSVDGRPTLYYTGVVGEGDEGRVESVCRAVASDDMTRFSKDSENPLVAGPPEGWPTGYHRDPYLWTDREGRTRMLLGSGRTVDGVPYGCVLGYRQTDDNRWQFTGVFAELPANGPGRLATGPLWECPQLVEDSGGTLLIFSVQEPEHPWPLRYSLGLRGEVHGDRFRINEDPPVRIDHGDVFYAPAVTWDPAVQRHLMWGWIQEPISRDLRERMTRVGALSLPRIISTSGGQVRVQLPAEIDALRADQPSQRHHGLQGPDRIELGPSRLQQELTLRITGAGRVDIELGLSPDPSEQLTVTVDRHRWTMSIDDRTPRLADGLVGADRRAPLKSSPHTDVRIFVDGSIIEVFADDHTATTTRTYPTAEQTGTVRLMMSDGAEVARLEQWPLDGGVNT